MEVPLIHLYMLKPWHLRTNAKVSKTLIKDSSSNHRKTSENHTNKTTLVVILLIIYNGRHIVFADTSQDMQ